MTGVPAMRTSSEHSIASKAQWRTSTWHRHGRTYMQRAGKGSTLTSRGLGVRYVFELRGLFGRHTIVSQLFRVLQSHVVGRQRRDESHLWEKGGHAKQSAGWSMRGEGVRAHQTKDDEDGAAQ